MRFSFGYIIATMPCGVVAGLAPLWEAEGDFDAAWGLNDIYRHAQHVPQLMFYDRACFRRAWLRNNQDPFWGRCLLKVDRFVAVDGHVVDCGDSWSDSLTHFAFECCFGVRGFFPPPLYLTLA